jgi:archaemetzincin
MSVLHLLPVGSIDGRVLEDLRSGLAESFRVHCEVLDQRLDPEFAFHAQRQQYHSTEILRRLEKFVRPNCWRLLGITTADLYMPILTFVFGEAQMQNTCAVVSLHRLRQEFYGLPADAARLRERLLKEAVHELGHTLGLTHCRDYECAMAASHSVEWIDVKGGNFCGDCFTRIGAQIPEKKLFGIF